MFIVTTPVQLALAVALFAALVALSGARPATVAASVRPIVPFALLVAVFNLFLTRTGTPLAQLGPLTITSDGPWVALLALRLVMAVGMGALLLLTTTPTAITDALESLLSPLGRLGLPAHEIAMIFSLALRFVPVIADEVASVRATPRWPAAQPLTSSLANRVRALSSVLVPRARGRHPPRRQPLACPRRPLLGGAGPHPLPRAARHGPRPRLCAACALWAAVLLALGFLGI